MKVQELLDMIKETPGIADYDMNLASYFSVPDSYISDDPDAPEITEEDVQIVVDFPIRAIAVNPDSKEVRFVLIQSDFSTIEQLPDKILKILRDRHET